MSVVVALPVAFMAGWALAALTVTLRPQPDLLDAQGRSRSRWVDAVPFAEIHDSLINAVSWHVAVEQVGGNLILFLPVAVGLAMLRTRQRPWHVGLVAGAGAGLVIECLQCVLGVRRVSSIDDVILAALGSALGFLPARPLTSRPTYEGSAAKVSARQGALPHRRQGRL